MAIVKKNYAMSCLEFLHAIFTGIYRWHWLSQYSMHIFEHADMLLA